MSDTEQAVVLRFGYFSFTGGGHEEAGYVGELTFPPGMSYEEPLIHLSKLQSILARTDIRVLVLIGEGGSFKYTLLAFKGSELAHQLIVFFLVDSGLPHRTELLADTRSFVAPVLEETLRQNLLKDDTEKRATQHFLNILRREGQKGKKKRRKE